MNWMFEGEICLFPVLISYLNPGVQKIKPESCTSENEKSADGVKAQFDKAGPSLLCPGFMGNQKKSAFPEPEGKLIDR